MSVGVATLSSGVTYDWEGRASLDIDVILDLMIHDLDILLTLVGSEVESIEALGANLLSAMEKEDGEALAILRARLDASAP